MQLGERIQDNAQLKERHGAPLSRDKLPPRLGVDAFGSGSIFEEAGEDGSLRCRQQDASFSVEVGHGSHHPLAGIKPPWIAPGRLSRATLLVARLQLTLGLG